MVKICQKCGFENTDQTFYCIQCGNAPLNICPKCGFENIAQTFYCSRCGNQIRWLPRNPIEDIDEKSLGESEKARRRDELLGEFLEGLLLGTHGSENTFKKDTVDEKEWKMIVKSEQKGKAQRRSSGGTRQSVERNLRGGQPQNPFEPNPDAHPSAVFKRITIEEMTEVRKKRKRKPPE
jgi:hypothetical protein